MKVYSSLLSLIALATVIPTATDADQADSCEDQSKCIDFTINKLNTDACNVGGECTIEVCMNVTAGSSNNFGTCPKGLGEQGFSHVCSQTDSSGCAQWETNGDPKLGQGTGDTCSDTGEFSGTPAFGDKCEEEENILMCQEGKPGDILYWIIKDGNNNTEEDPTINYPFTWHDVHNCNADVSCFNYEYKCGDGNSDVQTRKERTWAFTIPASDGGNCDPCTYYPPTPTPPSPTPPITPPTPTPPVTSPSQPTIPQNPTPSGGNGDPHCKSISSTSTEHFDTSLI